MKGRLIAGGEGLGSLQSRRVSQAKGIISFECADDGLPGSGSYSQLRISMIAAGETGHLRRADYCFADPDLKKPEFPCAVSADPSNG